MTRALVDGVMDLFPGADRQALQCLADLMAKEIIAARAGALDEAAKHCEWRASYFDGANGYREWTDAARSYRATANEIRAIPTSRRIS